VYEPARCVEIEGHEEATDVVPLIGRILLAAISIVSTAHLLK
jgi:hypothetical protein